MRYCSQGLGEETFGAWRYGAFPFCAADGIAEFGTSNVAQEDFVSAVLDHGEALVCPVREQLLQGLHAHAR